jgi:hypothetical protein
MGAYPSTYIGVFLEVPIEKKEVPYTVKVNSNGKEFKKGNFDPETGEELKEETRYNNEEVYPYPYIDDNDELEEDYFWMPQYHQDYESKKYFLLNFSSKYSSTLEECETYEYSDVIDTKSLIEEFKEEHKSYLEHYKNEGYNITIKYGIVNYAH